MNGIETPRFYMSAYGLAVKHGFEGTEEEWLESLKGERGPQGEALTYDDLTEEQKAAMKGEKGDKGDTGATGPQGPQGPQGEIGPEGPVGPKGLSGENGPQGEQGPQGIQGERGPEGPRGPQGETGPAGAAGRGIFRISLKESVGGTDTYTITFTDGSTWDFAVVNGQRASIQKEIITLTLPAEDWLGEGPYYQSFSLAGRLGILNPETVKVEPVFTLEQLDTLREAGVTGYQTENTAGVLTMTMTGAVPGEDLTVQFEAEPVHVSEGS